MAKYSFLEDVAARITPDEPMDKVVQPMLKAIKTSIGYFGYKAKAIAGGSIAKENFIKGDHDIDIYVKFNKKYDTLKISDHLARILEDLRKRTKLRHVCERLHGSRDYFRIKDSYNYEIVPVLDIKDWKEAKNVTDMSPLHAKWVGSITAKKPKLKGEIRLTKQFCKAQRVYGGESYIKGFPGHVIDILTIHYGSFLDLVRQAAKWKIGEVIDYYNHHKGKAIFNLNKSKLGPLIVIDPVMPQRNAAAAVSQRRLEEFIEACKKFLANPSAEFFAREPITPKLIRRMNKGRKTVFFKAHVVAGKEDVVGAKIVRAQDYIAMKAAKYGFSIHDFGFTWDKMRSAMLYFILKGKRLPPEHVVKGPPLAAKEHVARFKALHKSTFAKSGSIFAKERRETPDFEKFVLAQMRDRFLEDKITKLEVLEE